MDKVLLALGSNHGQDVRDWREYVGEDFPNWKIFAFEPIDMPFKSMYNNVELIRKAAWTYDGEIDLYVDKKWRKLGTTIWKRPAKNINQTAVKYPCIDLSKFIAPLFGSHIVCKMNIEGSEYPLIQHLMDTGFFNYINYFYIAWHVNKGAVTQEFHDKFEAKMRYECSFHDKYAILKDPCRTNMFFSAEVIHNGKT